MDIGFISTRFAGTDGVSLETAKWAAVCQRMGHRIFYCAGELEDDRPPGPLIPEMHFRDLEAVATFELAFASTEAPPGLHERIYARADWLKQYLHDFIEDYDIDVIVPQNVLAVPLQLPLGVALRDLIAETGIPTIAHNHDFYWERDYAQTNCVGEILDTAFPPDHARVQHVVINSLAQEAMKQRRGLNSVVVPNVFDFATPPPGIDDFNADFRSAVGLAEDDVVFLQPTRVIERKGIELAIELLVRLADPRCKLVLSHATDADPEYLGKLQEQADQSSVDLRFVADCIDTHRHVEGGHKTYTLWDAYVHADFATYPSLQEGFGNALLEAVYFRMPMLVNRYPVYIADIGPLGFDFVEIDGAVTDEAVEQVRELLEDRARRERAVERNYQLGLEHFSLEALERLLRGLLEEVE